eukprot:3267918-Pleurochrysis_carterae.AAC.1
MVHPSTAWHARIASLRHGLLLFRRLAIRHGFRPCPIRRLVCCELQHARLSEPCCCTWRVARDHGVERRRPHDQLGHLEETLRLVADLGVQGRLPAVLLADAELLGVLGELLGVVVRLLDQAAVDVAHVDAERLVLVLVEKLLADAQQRVELLRRRADGLAPLVLGHVLAHVLEAILGELGAGSVPVLQLGHEVPPADDAEGLRVQHFFADWVDELEVERPFEEGVHRLLHSGVLHVRDDHVHVVVCLALVDGLLGLRLQKVVTSSSAAEECHKNDAKVAEVAVNDVRV